MAKKTPKLAEPPNAVAEEAIPGETIEEWVERMNDEEGQAHDHYEPRFPQYHILETYDPNMGGN
jgi:hypothetical protein